MNHDEKTVLMAEMEETDESYTYKMKIGITYKESIEAVETRSFKQMIFLSG